MFVCTFGGGVLYFSKCMCFRWGRMEFFIRKAGVV